MKMQSADAIQIFQSAVAAVHPAKLLQQHLRVSATEIMIGDHIIPLHSVEHVYIIGAGKASAAMAVETENILGSLISDGLVTTKYGHCLPTKRIRIVEAAHPVPDENGVQAMGETLQLLKRATAKDLVICLISGGASALWCDVPPGITLQDMQKTFDLLLRSGADIYKMNTVRKHLSQIKGGQLIRHCGGAAIFSLIISDVPGDDLEVIASGPTVADASTFGDAYAILDKYDLLDHLPHGILAFIEKGCKGLLPETPKPGDHLFRNTVNRVIGANHIALKAAADKAGELRYHTLVLPKIVTGGAAAAAQNLVALAMTHQGEQPVCILQGGETTVQVTGNGKGGRNQHFALAALYELSMLQQENVSHQITLLSGGTDGTDGPTDATGAVIDRITLEVAEQKKMSIETYLQNNDSYHFFQQTGGLLITGPTQTNVMDVMITLINKL